MLFHIDIRTDKQKPSSKTDEKEKEEKEKELDVVVIDLGSGFIKAGAYTQLGAQMTQTTAMRNEHTSIYCNRVFDTNTEVIGSSIAVLISVLDMICCVL